MRHALVVADVEPAGDPPRVLVIGPDEAGNLLEVVMLSLGESRHLVIHAMALRRAYWSLLGEAGDA